MSTVFFTVLFFLIKCKNVERQTTTNNNKITPNELNKGKQPDEKNKKKYFMLLT